MKADREDRRLVTELMRVLRIRMKGSGQIVLHIADGEFQNAEARVFGLVGHEKPVDECSAVAQT